MSKHPTYQKNQILQGQVVDLSSDGAGVVKLAGYPFFVEGTIPGEIIRFKVLKASKTFGFGRLESLIEPSPDRVELKDPIGRQIGTMTLQHLVYEAQLTYKQNMVKEMFKRIGGFNDQLSVLPTKGMAEPWAYRNKAQIPVRMVNDQLETGFFRKNSHQLIPVENFHIQAPEIDQAVLTIRDILRRYHLSAYDEASHQGLIRHIIVKRGHYSGQMMVILVINGTSLPHSSEIVAAIVDQIPQVVSIVVNQNQQSTNVIMGQQSQVIWGQAYYQDQMMGLDFRISPHSFYQVNTPQAEVLYQCAIDAAQLSGQEVVLDAYCGIGTISLALAQHTKQVYAMEIVAEAIDMAKLNANLNDLENVVFEAGKAEEWLPNWSQAGIHFDVAVVDPPRKGLEASFIDNLIQLAPERIVYVSCNPATCARDCQLFAAGGYQLDYVQPVDMFPQTAHVEAVVLLTRSEAK